MERTIYEQSSDLTETCQVVHASSGSVRSWQMCFTSDAFESASADQKRGLTDLKDTLDTLDTWFASRSKHVPDLHRGHAHLRKATRFALLILFVLAALAWLLWITVNYVSLLFKLLVNSLEPCWSSECARMLKLLGCWTAKISNMPCLHQRRQRSNYHKACRETGQAQFPHAAPRSSWSSWSSSQHTNWGLL